MRLPDRTDPVAAAKRLGADVILPITHPYRLGSLAGVGWIPDFQHRYLPELFDERERQLRDRAYRRLSERCRLVLLSSEASRRDFVEFAPDLAEKARVASFPSSFAFSSVDLVPAEDNVRRIYGLPPRFALVVNQFWRHKNHAVVIEGLRRIARSQVDIPVVFVGRPADYRDPKNEVVSELLQNIAAGRLRENVWVLGEVPRSHLVGLMRTSTVVIQPSLFEGWSTSVQDARALGRPLICADLPVLREQAPRAVGFFDPYDPDELAGVLGTVWPRLQQGPDEAAEKVALQKEKTFATRYAEGLLDICVQAASR